MLRPFWIGLLLLAAMNAALAASVRPAPKARHSDGPKDATPEQTCETDRTGAFVRCVAFTGVRRERCEAKADDAYDECLERARAPAHK